TLRSSSVAFCSTYCRRGSAASVILASWRTPAASPSSRASERYLRRQNPLHLPKLSTTASATPSSLVIASTYAPSAEPGWSRLTLGRARKPLAAIHHDEPHQLVRYRCTYRALFGKV